MRYNVGRRFSFYKAVLCIHYIIVESGPLILTKPILLIISKIRFTNYYLLLLFNFQLIKINYSVLFLQEL